MPRSTKLFLCCCFRGNLITAMLTAILPLYPEELEDCVLQGCNIRFIHNDTIWVDKGGGVPEWSSLTFSGRTPTRKFPLSGLSKPIRALENDGSANNEQTNHELLSCLHKKCLCRYPWIKLNKKYHYALASRLYFDVLSLASRGSQA